MYKDIIHIAIQPQSKKLLWVQENFKISILNKHK